MKAYDNNADGTSDSISRLTQSFDRHDNLLSSVLIFDDNGDRTPDRIDSTTQSFDRHDNLLILSIPCRDTSWP